MTDAPVPAAELGYAEALAELEGIVRELEGEAVDVDHLAERVRRAAELITTCRSRIAAARFDVAQVVATLDDTAGPVRSAAPPTEP